MLKVRILPDGKRATEIFVAQLVDGKITKPVKGSLDDVKGECLVLPILRVQGGVYFLQKQFGCSLVASKLLVLQQERSTTDFAFGDVVMVDEFE